MRESTTTITCIVASCIAASLGGCGASSEVPADVQQSVANFVQKLELEIDGKSVEIPLEMMAVFLMESGPDTFGIGGANVRLVGQFPPNTTPGDASEWSRLVGRAIPISAKGWLGGEVHSSVTLPDQRQMEVTGGSFTVETVSPGFDAQTPLTGRLELKITTPNGPKTIQGKFSVKGTTLG